MKIAIIGSIWISIPPKNNGFGAQEYLAYQLAQGLISKGHEITLFASGDSQISGKLVSVTPKQVIDLPGHDSKTKDIFELLNLSEAFSRLKDFDLIHNHLLPYGLLFNFNNNTVPVVHTLHHVIYKDRADRYIYEKYAEQNFVSISNAQRKIFPKLNYVGTVYNGINPAQFPFKSKPGNDYILYLGRLKKYKGISTAIEIAKELGLKLMIAAPLPNPKQSDYQEVMRYWKEEIEPNLSEKIKYLGEIFGVKKTELLQNAKALIFPVEREEPFGMTVIEAMACGTPVVAYDRGAIAEIITPDSGFLVNHNLGKYGLLKSLKKLYTINSSQYEKMRQAARDRVEHHFTTDRMVNDYLKIYQNLIKKNG